MKILPLLCTTFALFYLAAGIAAKSAFLISEGALLLLLVLPALCLQIYETTPAYKRKQKKQMEEFDTTLKCINDLVELGKNKTDENVAKFKSKWPNFVQQITSSDLMCKTVYDKGVWKLFNELAKKQ